MQGRGLSPYYIREYETLATKGYRLPSRPIVQPVRETTPDGSMSSSPTDSDRVAALHGILVFLKFKSLLTKSFKGLPANWFMIDYWPDLNTSPSPTASQRDGGAIPGADGPAQQDGGATLGTDPSATDSNPAAPIHLPQLPRSDDGKISYESQGRVLFSNFEINSDVPFQSTSCQLVNAR